jgi:hypothetical protein
MMAAVIIAVKMVAVVQFQLSIPSVKNRRTQIEKTIKENKQKEKKEE